MNEKTYPKLTKLLGKITKAEFGHTGYQEMMVGLSLDFSFNSCEFVMDSIIGGWYAGNPCTPNSKWTVEENRLQHSVMVEKISQILIDAKVDHVSELKGKPVELIFEGTILKDWRILTEVL